MDKTDIKNSPLIDIAKAVNEEELKKYSKEQLISLYSRTKQEMSDDRNIRKEKIRQEHKNTISTAFSILKDVTGINAISKRKDSSTIEKECILLKNTVKQLDTVLKKELNDELQKFGAYKIETLKKTLGQFLGFLKEMEKKNKLKEYEILSEIDINIKEFNKTFEFTIKASEVVDKTVKSAAMAVGGGMVASQLAMQGMLAWGTASTGAAISSLSGAAATNAALAALGGGSIAAGGGGMAAGAVVLSTAGITVGGVVALLCAGSFASSHFSKKLTEAENIEKAVFEQTIEIEKGWEMMKLISERINELYSVMQKLEIRIYQMFELFEPLVSDFNYENKYQVGVFQKTGLLIKSISELANAALFNNNGDISEETNILITKATKITNEDLLDE